MSLEKKVQPNLVVSTLDLIIEHCESELLELEKKEHSSKTPEDVLHELAKYLRLLRKFAASSTAPTYVHSVEGGISRGD